MASSSWLSRIGWLLIGCLLTIAGLAAAGFAYTRLANWTPWGPNSRNDLVVMAPGAPVEIAVLDNDDPGWCRVEAEDPAARCPRIVASAGAITLAPRKADFQGDVSVTERGTIVFTPPPGYSGTERFWYSFRDSLGRQSMNAHVELRVGVADRP